MAKEVVKQVKEADAAGAIIILKFDSPGGVWEAGAMIAGAINEAKNPVVCVNTGHSASMTMVPFGVCPVRVVVKGSKLTFHEPFGVMVISEPSVLMLKMTHLRNELKMLEELNDIMAKLITSRWPMSAEDYKKKISGIDWTVPAEEAVQIKAADFMVSSYEEVLWLARNL